MDRPRLLAMRVEGCPCVDAGPAGYTPEIQVHELWSGRDTTQETDSFECPRQCRWRTRPVTTGGSRRNAAFLGFGADRCERRKALQRKEKENGGLSLAFAT
jgi:hypothetical protein